MRFVGVVTLTLCALSGCGKDPILQQVEADAARAKTLQEQGTTAPPAGGAGVPGAAQPGDASGGVPGAGQPGDGSGGVPGAAQPGDPSGGTPGAPGGALVAGKAEPPAPGDPSVPPPGGTRGDPSVPPPGGSIGVPVQPTGPGGPGGAPGGSVLQGPTVTVNGVVTYPEWKSGAVKISAFDGDHGTPGAGHPNIVAFAEVARPGPFTITVAQNAGKLYLEASVDENGDGKPGPLDPQGKATRFPVTIREAPVDGIEIVLARRAPPPGGRGEDF